MKIAGYLQTSLIEWPGKIAAVIFTPGCNFRCPFCHNKDLVEMNTTRLIPAQEILADLEKRKKWVDGLVITGGEPILQKDLDVFCKKVKNIGLEIMIETNGSLPEMIGKLIKENLVDFWAVDFKTVWEEYPKITDFEATGEIKKALKLILKSKKLFEVHTTIVPEIHKKKILLKMANQLKEIVGRRNVIWKWQNFQPKNTLDPRFEKLKPYSEKKINQWVQKVKKQISFSLFF